MKVWMSMVVGVSLASAASAGPPPAVMSAGDAVKLAATLGSQGHKGRYEMAVAATGKSAKATFLNSTADYKRDDNLTFSIAPIVAKMLTRQYGAPPEDYFKGRTMTVDGVLQNELIVNTFSGRPESVNRYQHTVRIERAAQIVAVR